VFLSSDTYNNLKISVSGFLEYSRNALACTEEGFYIPMLRSDTSSLEGLFSQIRTASVHSGTDLLQYEAFLKTCYVSTMNKSLQGEHTYDPEDADDHSAPQKFETLRAQKQKMQDELHEKEMLEGANLSFNKYVPPIKAVHLESMMCLQDDQFHNIGSTESGQKNVNLLSATSKNNTDKRNHPTINEHNINHDVNTHTLVQHTESTIGTCQSNTEYTGESFDGALVTEMAIKHN
jgi:hypothetical protein